MGRGNGGCLPEKQGNVPRTGSCVLRSRMKGVYLSSGSWLQKLHWNIHPVVPEVSWDHRLQADEGSQRPDGGGTMQPDQCHWWRCISQSCVCRRTKVASNLICALLCSRMRSMFHLNPTVTVKWRNSGMVLFKRSIVQLCPNLILLVSANAGI